MELRAWTGDRLDGEEFALATAADAATDLSDPMRMVASACSGPHQYVISLKRLGRFLVVHQELVLLCFDAPSLYLTVDQILRRIDGDAAAELFRGFFRTCRVHDVRLLDQLVRLASQGGHPVPRKLPELATFDPNSRADDEAVLALIAQGKPDVARGLADPHVILGACQDAAATFQAYRNLRQEADAMIRESLVPFETVERYGPLAVGLQTQAAIALDQAGRNGLLSQVEAGELKSSRSRVHRRASDALRKDKSGRFPFVWDGSLLAIMPSGHPLVTNTKELRRWLQRTSESVLDVELVPLARLMTTRDDLTVTPSLWSEHARCEPSIRAWIDLCAAADLERYLAPVGHGRAREINPSYEVVPRIRATRPSLEPIVDYERIQTFGPARGDFLIVGTLPDLKFRCLAELCERNSLSVRLAALFQAKNDPTHVAASCWLGHALDLQSLNQRREASPREYEIAMTTARVFLEAMVHAWAVRIPLRILKETHLIPIDMGQAKRYLRDLKGHVFPEVRALFAAEGVPSPVGRLRGGMPSRAQAWSAACLDLADDVMKVILFALFDAGYNLVGCTGDQFVLEGRRGTSRGSEIDSELISRIGELVKVAAEGLLEHVPVSCKIVRAEKWRPGTYSNSWGIETI